MKLPLLLALPIAIFGFELNFSKEFSTSVLPNELTSSVRVVVENKDEKEVMSSLNIYNRFLTKYKKVKKTDLSMSITPKYSYKDGVSSFQTFSGVLSYSVTSEKSSEIKEFLEKFYELKDDESHSLFMPSIKWKIDDKAYENELEKLRLNAIVWTNKYAKDLSKELHLSCLVTKIDISSNISRPISYSNDMLMLRSSKKVDAPILEKVNQTIMIKPNISLECKWLFVQEEQRALNLQHQWA